LITAGRRRDDLIPNLEPLGDVLEESRNENPPFERLTSTLVELTKPSQRQKRIKPQTVPERLLEGHEDEGLDGQSEIKVQSPDDTPRKFACPYYKRSPEIHQKRICAGPGWSTVARIKEHLYRVHALPVQCKRFGLEFRSEKADTELEQHQRSLESCELRHEELAEGLSKEQEKMLRSKKRPARAQSEAEKWEGMYRILFPLANEASIPSPHYELLDALARYEQYANRELPCRVRNRLQSSSQENMENINIHVVNQVLKILRDCRAEVIHSFRSGRDLTQEIHHEDLGETTFPTADLDANPFEEGPMSLCESPMFGDTPQRPSVLEKQNPRSCHIQQQEISSDSGCGSLYRPPLDGNLEAMDPGSMESRSGLGNIFPNYGSRDMDVGLFDDDTLILNQNLEPSGF